LTRFGRRTFVGNSAVIPSGADLGDNVLVATLSTTPVGPDLSPPGVTWLGSPPLLLPTREKPPSFSEASTYNPSRALFCLRLGIEFWRVLLPSTLFVVVAALIVDTTDILQDHIGLWEWLAAVPFLYAGAGILGTVFTILLKWVLAGRYRPCSHPLWSLATWRTELVTGIFENFAVMFFLDTLRGTPFLAWVLRLLGAKVGHRCYIDTTWFTEFDLIEIGDEVALNENANLQTHLFTDRVMTAGPVRLARRSSVGWMSTVLLDAGLGERTSLGDLSLVIKGESLPASSRWQGIPAHAQ
jgi:non-ribosomal peptide synthetase-like protein